MDKASFATSKDYVLKNAEMKLDKKVEEIGAESKEGAGNNDKRLIVIAADTIISIDDKDVMEKPRDEDHAFQMLSRLRDVKVH